MDNVQEKPQTQIRKIMERESAQKQIEEIKLKICGVDTETLCADEIKDSVGKLPDYLTRSLENAVMLGLVYWNETENFLVQKFIKPLASGELSASELHYKNRLNVNKLKGFKATSELDFSIEVLSQISGRPKHLLGELWGQDLQITMGCLNFFEQ